MEIDKNAILMKLGTMSDEELQSVISQIAQAAGIRPEKAQRAMGNMDKVKRSIYSMSDGDLKKAMGMLDEKTVGEIKKTLDNGGKSEV